MSIWRAGEAAGPAHPGQERPGVALLLAPTFGDLTVPGSALRLAFLRISFALRAEERSLSGGTRKWGSFRQFPRSCPVWGAGGGADTDHSDELGTWGR